jgi:hypothetical protein
VWTTLALTIHADGATEAELAGASPFPRHWLYDHQGKLVQKSGVIDFESWNRQSFGRHNPWGGEDAPVVVTAVESALERALSPAIIAANPPFQRLKPGQVLVEQGAAGGELFLLFDGILAVEVDGRVVAQVGPGAIVGEMALVDSGRRTATLRAVTPGRVAAVRGDRFADRAALEELARRRRGQPDPQPDAKPDGQADAQPGGGAED